MSLAPRPPERGTLGGQHTPRGGSQAPVQTVGRQLGARRHFLTSVRSLGTEAPDPPLPGSQRLSLQSVTAQLGRSPPGTCGPLTPESIWG